MSMIDQMIKDWEKRKDELAELDRHYRGAGIAFSVSLSSLCGALMFWTESLIQKAPAPHLSQQNILLLLQFGFLASTIFLCLIIQFCNYQGYRFEALGPSRRKKMEDVPPNSWFIREDTAVYLAVSAFMISLILCTASFIRSLN